MNTMQTCSENIYVCIKKYITMNGLDDLTIEINRFRIPKSIYDN